MLLARSWLLQRSEISAGLYHCMGLIHRYRDERLPYFLDTWAFSEGDS